MGQVAPSSRNVRRFQIGHDVCCVVEQFFPAVLIERDLKKGPGIFNLVGMMKIKMVYKPAVAARKGINPFTKEEVIFKAKPARNVVKVQPLKMLKDMV